MTAAPEASQTVELLDKNTKRVQSAIAQLRIPALDVRFDAERSRLFRFAGRTFVVAFNRGFFGRGSDFEHLRGRRSLIGVVGQASPVEADRFEAHRLIVLDHRSPSAAQIEIRRLDGSVANAGLARLQGNRLIASISMALPHVPLAGSIEANVRTDGAIRLTKARLSIRTTSQAPSRVPAKPKAT